MPLHSGGGFWKSCHGGEGAAIAEFELTLSEATSLQPADIILAVTDLKL